MRPTKVAAPKRTDWRDIKRSDPSSSREIFVATNVAGRAHDVATGAAVGAIGGVYPGDYRGGRHANDPWVHDPWGWNGWNHCSGWSWTWGSSCWAWCGWSYAWYWSWYYPCWWWYSRPYYYADYCYYPATTVVYSSPEVIYVDRPSEPVGETVVAAPSPAPAAEVAPAPAPNPLSIAAQRYLELGDRAFREGRYTDAVQFYAKSIEFAPDQGALYLVLSDALFAAGDYHYGAYAVRRALELDPSLVESTVDKHGFYPEPTRFDEQLVTLERYLADHAEDRDARLVLALNYLFAARPGDAVRLLESTRQTTNDDPAAQRILERARLAAR